MTLDLVGFTQGNQTSQENLSVFFFLGFRKMLEILGFQNPQNP